MTETISDSTGLPARAVAAAALKSGLTVEACEELLAKGWVYKQGWGDVPRWLLYPNPANPAASIPSRSEGATT